MANYLVNKTEDSNGYHEVHTENCSYLPEWYNQETLGWFSNCQQVVKKAESLHPSWEVDGCMHCSPTCHKG